MEIWFASCLAAGALAHWAVVICTFSALTLAKGRGGIMARKPILKLVPPAEGCTCAFFALEPHIRDLHRMAQLAAMAALGGNDERTRFGVFQLERMVDASAPLLRSVRPKTSDPNAQVTRGDCVSTLWRPHGDIRLGSKNCRRRRHGRGAHGAR